MRGAVIHSPGDVCFEGLDDPAPVRRYLTGLIDRVLSGRIEPGKVFDLTLPLEQVAEGYRAMDERRAIKALLKP
ncbi:hypothetical protein GCM10011428_07800 [Streptomyces violaceus]